MRFMLSMSIAIRREGKMKKFKLWPFWSEDAQNKVKERISKGDIYASSVDPIIEKFEMDFLAKCAPSQKYSVFCNTGTAGLFAAYFALNLDSDAEVLVPTHTFRATVTPMLSLGLTPIFCDCDYSTGVIDFEDVVQKITPRTQALVVTHLNGNPVNMQKAVSIAKKFNLALIEDCSHAHGTMWENQHVGTFGDIGVFSLGTKKMISGGTGGIVVTNNRLLYERVVLLCSPKPWAKTRIKDLDLQKYISTGLGFNLRGNPISAILANEHLERLDGTIRIKNKNLSIIDKMINKYLPDLKTPIRDESFSIGTFYSYQCKWEHPIIKRDLVFKELLNLNISVDKPSGLLHRQPIFSSGQSIFPHLNSSVGVTIFNNYMQSQKIIDNAIQFDTRDLYEVDENVIFHYEESFQKTAEKIYSTV